LTGAGRVNTSGVANGGITSGGWWWHEDAVLSLATVSGTVGLSAGLGCLAVGGDRADSAVSLDAVLTGASGVNTGWLADILGTWWGRAVNGDASVSGTVGLSAGL
jgi:hypothetical protein